MKKEMLKKVWLIATVMPVVALAQGELAQVHEDFSKDPGWEWKHNRIEAENPPTIKQDFGWSPTNHTGAGPGEIGGRIWMSRTPAYYAIPLNRPLSFREPISFSGRISFLPTGGGGAAYLGFFNHKRQGWRVWNSMAMRLGGETSGEAAFGADTMTALWHSQAGSEGYIHVPADGRPHTFSFSYDPDATMGEWPDPADPRLANYLTAQRRTADEILERARQDEPNLTKEELWERLLAAHAKGLIKYLQRTGHESIIGTTAWSGRYWFRKDFRGKKGAMTIQVDDSRPFTYFIFEQGQNEPVYMDRFGLFNLQLYHQYIDLYIGDLTVNGQKVDLSKDPAWEGRGNRVQFVERDFQRGSYGFAETNWAGEDIGEIGGLFTSTETIDPMFGYYADDAGKLTLDDPISFSGNVCYVSESTDAGMFIGYFNSKSIRSDLTKRPKRLKTIMNSMGVLVEGSAHGGKDFMPQITTTHDIHTKKKGLEFRPIRLRRPFKFEYDPKANNNLGRITVTFAGKAVSLDLTPQQRADGATFDRFGVHNLRAGGKFVEVYYDDLTYTVRRAKNYRPVFHKQEVTKVPYPKGGRKY